MNKVLKIVFIVILLLLIFPATQKYFSIFKIAPLNGAFVKVEKPDFIWDKWFSGEFQSKYDQYLEENIGFRNLFVRLHNQIDYSLFRKANAEGVVVGKNDYLFEEDYIYEYLGDFFIGKEAIDKKLERVKFLQDTLKKGNIELIIVVEPGKASFYPEYIPEKYDVSKKSLSNYEYYVQRSNELGINILDLNKYFKLMKDTSRYPLYPKSGIHWSVYGMTCAVDTLIKYIENIHEIDVPDIYCDSIDLTDSMRLTDYDLGNTMNLLWKIPQPQMAYPNLRFENNPEKTKPAVLAIGDSYYLSILAYGIPKNIFSNEPFWYYNKNIYPESYTKSKIVDEINLKEEIEKQDVILLMITERFFHCFIWGFVENAYKIYKPDYTEDNIYNHENNIRFYDKRFKKIFTHARKENKSLEEMIRKNAEHQFYTEFKKSKNKSKEDYIKYIEWVIRNDEKWLNSIKRTAEEKNLDLDKLITDNAKWMYMNKMKKNN